MSWLAIGLFFVISVASAICIQAISAGDDHGHHGHGHGGHHGHH